GVGDPVQPQAGERFGHSLRGRVPPPGERSAPPSNRDRRSESLRFAAARSLPNRGRTMKSHPLFTRVRAVCGRKARVPRPRLPLRLELLEDRWVPAVFNVNSTADIFAPAAGTVTLRSAIQAANTTPGPNTINLTVAGTYRITLPGANTGSDSTGAFAILPTGGDLTITNTSGGMVTVDGNHLDRVFD